MSRIAFPPNPRTLGIAAALTGLLLTAPALGAPPLSRSASGGPYFPWRADPARIGIQIQPMTPELRAHMGAPADRGVLVVRVEPEGPADRAGVRVGDVATALDGRPIDSPRRLVHAVHRARDGGTLSLSLVRDGEILSLEVEPRPQAGRWSVDDWSSLVNRHLEEGRGELRRRLDRLEERLDALQQAIEERLSRVVPEPH